MREAKWDKLFLLWFVKPGMLVFLEAFFNQNRRPFVVGGLSMFVGG